MNIKNDPTILQGLEIHRAKRKLDIVETITGIVAILVIIVNILFLAWYL